MTRYIITGRMRIWKYWFSDKYETYEEFVDRFLFDTLPDAEVRLKTLQTYAHRINTPPFPMGEERERLLKQTQIDSMISALEFLRVTECEISIITERFTPENHAE